MYINIPTTTKPNILHSLLKHPSPRTPIPNFPKNNLQNLHFSFRLAPSFIAFFSLQTPLPVEPRTSRQIVPTIGLSYQTLQPPVTISSQLATNRGFKISQLCMQVHQILELKLHDREDGRSGKVALVFQCT
jgi:hypothetical protein